MPEIQLPTKTTQDAIKVGVDTLLAERSVKGIQRGEAIFQEGSNTLTVTVNAVKIDKSLLEFSNTAGGAVSAGPTASTIKGTLTNSTTLTFKVSTGTSNNPVQVSWQLVEYY